MEIKTENKRKIAKAIEIFHGGVKMEKTEITNLFEKKEFKIDCCSNTYDCEINFNEDRNARHAIVKNNGRTQSLSFFPKEKMAEKAIYDYIKMINQESTQVGD